MFNWSTVLAMQERYKDLLREAERERLVRQALAEREKCERFYCQALIWLGRGLVAWGWRLLEPYGARLEPPTFQGARGTPCADEQRPV